MDENIDALFILHPKMEKKDAFKLKILRGGKIV
jgi:hypothetical protein